MNIKSNVSLVYPCLIPPCFKRVNTIPIQIPLVLKPTTILTDQLLPVIAVHTLICPCKPPPRSGCTSVSHPTRMHYTLICPCNAVSLTSSLKAVATSGISTLNWTWGRRR